MGFSLKIGSRQKHLKTFSFRSSSMLRSCILKARERKTAPKHMNIPQHKNVEQTFSLIMMMILLIICGPLRKGNFLFFGFQASTAKQSKFWQGLFWLWAIWVYSCMCWTFLFLFCFRTVINKTKMILKGPEEMVCNVIWHTI